MLSLRVLTFASLIVPTFASVQILLPEGIRWQFPTQESSDQWNPPWQLIQFNLPGQHDLGGKFNLDIPGVGRPKCKLTGTEDPPAETMITFVISPETSYLHPCGPNHGVTVVCTDPVSICL